MPGPHIGEVGSLAYYEVGLLLYLINTNDDIPHILPIYSPYFLKLCSYITGLPVGIIVRIEYIMFNLHENSLTKHLYYEHVHRSTIMRYYYIGFGV